MRKQKVIPGQLSFDDLIENASALRGKNMDNYSARARAFEDVIKELDRILRDG